MHPSLGGVGIPGCLIPLFFRTGSLLYEQLGHKAYGLAGKLAASGSITMQNIGGKFGEGTSGRLHSVAGGGDPRLRRRRPHFALVMV